ncbi:MAG: acyltransferase family protein [Candidatus Hermodarchaeota archaeon]
METKKLAELDILRIIAILIVVILIHIPNNYAYPFAMDYTPYQGFLLHTLGIHVAMGSLVFVSGFGLYLNKNNRNINNTKKLFGFLKKRFLRIFPLYWIALILFIIFFGYWDQGFFYIFAHILGIQMVVAPTYGWAIWTLWFIGIIVIYYLIFIILSFTGSIKWIIPTALIILLLFAIIHIYTGLFEYRFFYYYLLFILGIISANLYTSSQYARVKEFLKNKSKYLPIIVGFGTAALSIVIYLILTQYCFSYFNSEYGTTFLFQILDLQPGIIESAVAVLLIDLIILVYIIFIVSLSYAFISSFKLLLPKIKINKTFSIVAYSTFCAYLFHRIFLVIYTFILSEGLNLDIRAFENLYLVLLFVPFIFLFSYFIQKGTDRVLKRFSSKRTEVESD